MNNCKICTKCYCDVTGIYPLNDCPKYLLNGPCFGAKEGKCEVNIETDCAWQKIIKCLSAQGRLKEYINQPVLIRDYSKEVSGEKA